MKKIILCLLVSAGIAALSPSHSIAGAVSSGGGPSVVCRDSNKKIEMAELLDFYEGRVRFGLNIPESPLTVDEQLQNAARTLSAVDPTFALEFLYGVDLIKKRMSFLPVGVGIYPGGDLGSEYAVLLPSGCGLELAGYYETDGTLKVSQDIYSRLSPTNQAMFLAHEAIYYLARIRRGVTNSADSRHLNALIFSTNPDPEKIKHLGYTPFSPKHSYDHRDFHIFGFIPTVAEFVEGSGQIRLEIQNPNSKGLRYYFRCVDEETRGASSREGKYTTATSEAVTLPDRDCAFLVVAMGSEPNHEPNPGPSHVPLVDTDGIDEVNVKVSHGETVLVDAPYSEFSKDPDWASRRTWGRRFRIYRKDLIPNSPH